MASFNKVILLGNLTRDPELRMTSTGAPICKFGLAASRAFTTADGNRREEVLFIDVDAFGRPAEVIAKYSSKGKPLLVEGRLRFDQWEGQNGERRNKLTVVLESFQFVGAKPETTEEGAHPYEDHVPSQRTSSTRPSVPPVSSVSNDLDEDVPF